MEEKRLTRGRNDREKIRRKNGWRKDLAGVKYAFMKTLIRSKTRAIPERI